MNNESIEQFVELLYPYILKKIQSDSTFKNNVKMKNATVSSAVSNGMVEVKFPYDNTSITVIDKTGETLAIGDSVCVMYWIDLKNAVAIFKVKEM